MRWREAGRVWAAAGSFMLLFVHVADGPALDHEDDHLGNIGCVIGNTL
jgi:drug/metabolite transporter superfamily protein YnfA